MIYPFSKKHEKKDEFDSQTRKKLCEIICNLLHDQFDLY